MDEEPKHYLIGRLREALAEDSRTNELNVQIAIAGHRVFLTGSVTTPERLEAITEVAGETVPGYEIHNQVIVIEPTETSETERLT